MSAQKSNTLLQAPQQSRTAHSNLHLPLSSQAQKRTLMATTSSSVPKKATPRFFEDYGLCVPLIRYGQKRPHARAASELASKSKASLLEIVKDYAANKVSKLKSASKSDIVQWIERVETLALGPHPKTQLPSTKKEDLIEALGLKTIAPKAKGNTLKKDAPQKKSDQRRAAPPTKDKVVAQSIVSFSLETDKSELKAAPAQQVTPPAPSPPQPSPKPVATQKQVSHDTSTGSVEATQKANKRKYDSAAAPTDVEQTPPKKTRVVQTPSPKATKSPQMSIVVTSQAQVVETAPSAPVLTEEQASQDREAPVAAITPPAPANEPQIYEDEQEETDISPKKKKDPSTVIHLENEDIIVTHVPLETYKYITEYDIGNKTRDLETPDGGRSYTTKTERAVCFTHIPHGYNGDACIQHDHGEEPFLKPGVHGRHGDFASDPDLLTGRGHQIEPADLRRKRQYEAKHRAFYNEYPFFPYADAQRKYLASEHVEGLAELRQAERWMRAYREKYAGENVAHLWDCGCEMVRSGEESEEE